MDKISTWGDAMQEYFSGNKYISTTGDRFLYENETRYIFAQISLKEKLDADHLKNTAKAMMNRCPYFQVKRGIHQGRYCLMQVKEDIPVIENEGFVLPLNKGSNDFLLVIAYHQKTIYFCFHHALTDANGVVRFVKSFVAEYLRQALKTELKVPEELRPGTPVKVEEYENPYNHLIHQEHPFQLHSVNGFSFPAEDIGDHSRHLRVSIPTDRILKISKDAESTFASVIVMFVSNAIRKVYPVQDEPIKIYCPVDMREMLDCPHTLQHCCYGIRFVFGKKLLDRPLNQQLSCLKGMLMLQTSEEYLIDRMEKQEENHEKICSKENSIEDIKEIYNGVQYDEPMVSYLKNIDFGDAGAYIEDFDISIPVRGLCGVVLYAYCINEKCILNFQSKLLSKDIFNGFLDTLQDFSIPYTVIEKDRDLNIRDIKE